MQRLFVTFSILALLAFSAGCAEMTTPFGLTAAGGKPVSQSVLLGVPLPAGMAFYPSHSHITGQDGLETLRGSAGPALCAATLASGLQAQGWKLRLSQTKDSRAMYIFDNGGRIASIHISVQTPPMLTVVEIAASAPLPDGSSITLPISSTGSSDSSTGGQGSEGSGQYDSGGISTAPLSGSTSTHGNIQERNL